MGLDEVVGTWPSDAELVEWFRSGHAALVAALAAAPPDLECLTFLRGAPSPLAHWARRQAHETAIHRVDTELAAGSALSPVDAAVAADGVDELLCAFVPRRSTRLRAETPTALRVRSTDGDASTRRNAWVLRIDGAGVSAARCGRRRGRWTVGLHRVGRGGGSLPGPVEPRPHASGSPSRATRPCWLCSSVRSRCAEPT